MHRCVERLAHCLVAPQCLGGGTKLVDGPANVHMYPCKFKAIRRDQGLHARVWNRGAAPCLLWQSVRPCQVKGLPQVRIRLRGAWLLQARSRMCAASHTYTETIMSHSACPRPNPRLPRPPAELQAVLKRLAGALGQEGRG